MSAWKLAWAKKGMVKGRLLLGGVRLESSVLVEKVGSAAASWFFETGGHTSDGADFEVTVFPGT